MNHAIWTAIAAGLALAGCGEGNQQSISVGGGATTGNISQSQSGWGNSQSMSIGNVDGDAKPAKTAAKGRVSSTQADPETGNKQSADVTGSAIVSQNQGGRDNSQSALVDGSGNISQSQNGSNNRQSLAVGGNGNSSGTPSVTQAQTGANRKQSMVINGKKVESSSN